MRRIQLAQDLRRERPGGLLAILLSVFIQKEWRGDVRHPFDWKGFAAIVLFMPLTIFALARGNSATNHEGWASPTVIACFAVAAAAFAFFIVTELRNPTPLLQIRLLGERNFGISMGVLTLFAVGMLGGTYLLPLYMQRGLGYTALMAGSVFLPVGLIQGVLSAVSGYMTRYVKPLLPVVAGILAMALSFWLASRFTIHTTHRHILFVLYLRGFGMGLTFAPLNLFSLKNLTQQDMAAAAGISNSIKQLAGSFGIALLTVVFTARTAFHAAHETQQTPQTYVEGVTDALTVVVWITLAAALPCSGRSAEKRSPAMRGLNLFVSGVVHPFADGIDARERQADDERNEHAHGQQAHERHPEQGAHTKPEMPPPM